MPIEVGVFFGGQSVEHEVSIISGLQALHALDKTVYHAQPVYLTKEGDFVTGDALLTVSNYRDLPALIRRCKPVYLRRQGGGTLPRAALCQAGRKRPLCVLDAALPVLHGTLGEDGTLQGLFELLGLPYAGCDVLASAVGMDKAVCKQLLAAAGLPVLPAIQFNAREWADRQTVSSDTLPTGNPDVLTEAIEQEIGYPCMVKPAGLGSSVGISMAHDRAALVDGVALATEFCEKILVERAVTALTEINCAVLGDRDNLRASVCEQPLSAADILSYADKYDSKLTGLKRRLPAPISAEKTAEIQTLAMDAFRCIGASGTARIDFLMDNSDNDKVYINEINTIPGSLSFYLWEADGLPFADLLDTLLTMAFARAREKARLCRSIDSNLLRGGVFGAKGKS